MDHDGPVCAADAGKEGIVQLVRRTRNLWGSLRRGTKS
jgi:hypothetical protein